MHGIYGGAVSYYGIYLGYDVAWCDVQGNTCRYHDTAIRPKAGIEIVDGSGTINNLVTNNDLLNGGVIPPVYSWPGRPCHAMVY